MFHSTLVKSPALFLLSKTDPVGAVDSNQRVKESWESLGKLFFKSLFASFLHPVVFQVYHVHGSVGINRLMLDIIINTGKNMLKHCSII